jgi:hypothetical protein
MNNEGQTAQTERASRWFWASDDFYNIVQVIGYECPSNDGVWWVPALGYSLTENHHLFKTGKEARQAAIDKLEASIAGLQTALDRLRKAGN